MIVILRQMFRAAIDIKSHPENILKSREAPAFKNEITTMEAKSMVTSLKISSLFWAGVLKGR